MTHPVRVSLQTHPQAGTYDAMLRTWQEADALGADAIFIWDHFYPLYGEPDAPHFGSTPLLAALGASTKNVQFGALVNGIGYRNPNLLADEARTIDHISHGRFIFGVGSGWFQRDYDEYGYDFKTAPDRLRDLKAALPVIKDRLGKLNPGPVNGKLPIMIGGGGEKVTLRIVAEHADIWNGFGDPEAIAAKSAILDEWCAKIGRNPDEIERSVLIAAPEAIEQAGEYVAKGITHIIYGVGGPDYDLDQLKRLLEWKSKLG
ncbi:LLM class F420-dependent oxidoreductase [soil metagenome]